VKRLALYFGRAYPAASAILLGCLVLAALMEGIGLSTLVPLLTLATSPGSADPGTLSGGFEARVRGLFEGAGIEPTLGVLLVVIVGAFWTKGALLLLAKRQVGYTVARVATDLRLKLLGALLATRWSTTVRQPAGAAANAMATEATRASYAYEYLALIVTYAIETLAYVVVSVAISWQATLAAGVAAFVTLALLSGLVRIAGRAGRKQTELLKSLLGRLTDALQAVKLLKATGREEAVRHLLDEDTRRLNKQLKRRVLAKESMRALQEPILVTLICAGLFVAVQGFGMPTASVLVLVFAFARILMKVNSIQSKYQSLVAEASALWSLDAMIEAAEAERERDGGAAPPRLETGIELEHVSIRFDGAPVLEDVSLQFTAGAIHAIVGPSGAGKTTIVDLLTGLVAPDTGHVRVDGVELAGLDLRAWRRQIGYVPQETLLLHDSVRANVTLGDPDVSEAQLEQALRDAGAWEFVAAMPDGIESSVGERGALLSGGQRQRIAIARSLIHAPRLLILDEATAALDEANERAVWETVATLRGRTTVIAISHQPALATIADRVYRIAGGRVVESVAREVA
jgi:ATP-binding cassette subfamily C protein